MVVAFALWEPEYKISITKNIMEINLKTVLIKFYLFIFL